jgi:hypothetical protein
MGVISFFRVFILFVCLSVTNFAVDDIFSFSAVLKDSDGKTLLGAFTKDIEVSLWDSEISGTNLYIQPKETLTVIDGVVSLEIGPGLPDLSQPLWVELTVDGQVLSPRTLLAPTHSSLFSLNSTMLDGMTSEEVLSLVQAKIDSALASPQVTGGAINGVPIGVMVPDVGVFTTITGDGAGITGLTPAHVGLDNVLNEQQLTVSNNLSDLSDSAKARANLGLNNVLNEQQLTVSNNLSDLSDPAAARANLGLENVSNTTQLSAASNLSDLTDITLAKTNLGLNNVLNTMQLSAVNNLSDFSDLTQAKTNLGLELVLNEEQLTVANNLSDLTDTAAARLNLGLGSMATQESTAILVSGGSMDGVTVGASVPAEGYFTTVAAGFILGDGAGLSNIALNQILTVGDGGKYSTITEALSSITDNSAIRPYVIKLAPGVYSESVVMKPYVDLEGAGRHNTIIQDDNNSAVVTAASTSEVRMVSIINTNAAASALKTVSSENTSLYRANLSIRPVDPNVVISGAAIYVDGGNIRVTDCSFDGFGFSSTPSTEFIDLVNVEYGSEGSAALPVNLALHCSGVMKNGVLMNRSCSDPAVAAADIVNFGSPSVASITAATTAGEYLVKWQPVKNATSYTIYIANSPTSYITGPSEKVEVDSSATSFVLTSIGLAQPYYVAVKAHWGSIIESDFSNSDVYPAEEITVWYAGDMAGGSGWANLQGACEASAISKGIPVGIISPWMSRTTASVSSFAVPASKPVVSDTGVQIKSDYASIWADGTLDNSLQTAVGISADWWTGSTMPGNTASDNCNDWEDPGANGIRGWGPNTDGVWIDRSTGAALCSNNFAVLCIGW